MLDIKSTWDFRSDSEKHISEEFESNGFIVSSANKNFLLDIRKKVESTFEAFCENNALVSDIYPQLENAHKIVDSQFSNDLRLFVINQLYKDKSFNYLYYLSCKEIVDQLCGNELAMQKKIGFSIQFPTNVRDVLPIHADTWNGVSAFDLNIWIPLVDCTKTMCLYILERDEYLNALEIYPDLLEKSSIDIFKTLKSSLTWIEIQYGDILAFDQSLPHGYDINNEQFTQWSMNCRFKNIFSPYSDKKLGEYYIPITVRSTTRIGVGYQNPSQWIRK